MSQVPIISVTGTKGKTTTVAAIADMLQRLQHNVLKVDTTGHFINGERRSTLDDSKTTWRLVPSVCPGRYLWEFYAQPQLVERGVAVLECSLGCSGGVSGLGYRYHKVGVFLNVFEDHIGSSARIQSKEDIAEAKSFVFTRLLHSDSWAVFNADDSLVCKTLAVVPKHDTVALLPCGFTFAEFDLAGHVQAGGKALTVNESKELVLRSVEGDEVLADLKVIPWTFNGTFIPSLWNIMQAVAAVYAFYDGVIPTGLREAIESIRLDNYGGRLTLLKNDKGVTVLADYAHEKVSLVEVAKLARSIAAPTGRVIGVVRLAHDRSDQLMRETGEAIAPFYDRFVVFDKIDGYVRQPKLTKNRFPEVVGRTSEIFASAIKSINPHVERIVREDEAIARAAAIARPGDVVVDIVNDDIERSLTLIKEAFKADFA